MISAQRDGPEEVSRVGNPVGFRQQVVLSDFECCRREFTGVKPDMSGGFQQLEKIPDGQGISIPLQTFAQPCLAMRVARIDPDFIHTFAAEYANRPENEEDVDFHALTSHFPGKSQWCKQAVEGVVADDDGQMFEVIVFHDCECF